MGQLLQDIKHSVRILITKPMFTVAAILILAIGIGATTAIFSVVNGVLLRPLPFPNSARLVRLWESHVGGGYGTISPPNLKDWRDQTSTFDRIAVYTTGSMSLSADSLPIQAPVAFISGEFFSVLGVEAALGRTIQEGEDQPGRDHVVVLSDRLWRSSFGADPSIIDRPIRLDGESYTVIGVARPDLNYPSTGTDIWAPLVISPGLMSMRGNHYLFGLGLLKPGVTMAQAQADMTAIGNRIEQAYPAEQTGRNVRLLDLKEETVFRTRPALLIILGAVFFVLLIVCANIANLQLARAAGRRKEIAIRGALGASSTQLARQFVTESLVLALLGGALGVIVAKVSLGLLMAIASAIVPRSSEVTLDLRVLGVALGLTLLTGLAFGLAPALYSARMNTHDALKDGGRLSGSGSHRRIYALLISGETALALVLLAGAGLMLKSFTTLAHTNTGLDPQGVLTVRVTLPPPKYRDSAGEAAFYKQARERISALPGVKSAAFISFVPLQQTGVNSFFKIEGMEPSPPGHEPWAERRAVTPGYFETMGIPIIKGRGLTEQDNKGAAQVVVINESLAKYFPAGKDPVGGHIQIDETWCAVVGVAKDVRQSGLYRSARPESFRPYAQETDRGLIDSMSLVIKTAQRPEALAGLVREQITAIDPGQPVYGIETMDAIIADSIADSRLNSTLLGTFAGIAMLLAIIGIYGVVSFWTAERTKEIGLRVALGASRGQVLGLIMKRGMTPVALGILIGVPGTIGLTRFMSAILYPSSTIDPVIVGGVVAILASAGLLACLAPASRASRIDPMVALRED